MKNKQIKQIGGNKERLREKKRTATYIAHVLGEKVLQSLAHRVALGHDALAAVVTRAGRVGHEGGATDDALQALLQRGAEALLAKAQRVHDNLLLLGGKEGKSGKRDEGGRERGGERKETMSC